jgi:hypothetical protein
MPSCGVISAVRPLSEDRFRRFEQWVPIFSRIVGPVNHWSDREPWLRRLSSAPAAVPRQHLQHTQQADKVNQKAEVLVFIAAS